MRITQVPCKRCGEQAICPQHITVMVSSLECESVHVSVNMKARMEVVYKAMHNGGGGDTETQRFKQSNTYPCRKGQIPVTDEWRGQEDPG